MKTAYRLLAPVGCGLLAVFALVGAERAGLADPAEERVVYPLPRLERRESARAAKGALTEVGSIGTEYGREIDSRAYYVPFLRGSNKQTITLYYDTVKALRDAGVPVDRPLPVPFPGDLPFAPPPPGYRGK